MLVFKAKLQLAHLEQRLIEANKKYPPSHPVIVILKGAINRLRGRE